MKNRKTFGWSLTLILVFTLILSGCGNQGSASSKEANKQASDNGESTSAAFKVTIADIVTNPTFQVALEEGIFEKYNIDATIATFATPAEGINSLFINQVNVAYGADFPVLNAVAKGEYSIIAATGTGLREQDAERWKLYVSNDIQAPEDFARKKLSFSRGTFIPYLWDEFLTEQGVDPAEVQFIGQGGFDESYIALKGGEIDGVWVIGSVLLDKFATLENAYEYTTMASTDVRIGGDIIISNALIKENREGVKNLLLAIDEASAFISNNPERVADIMYDNVKQPRENTIRDLQDNIWDIHYSEEAYTTITGLKDYMLGEGIIENDFDLASKFDLSLLQEALPDRVTFVP